MKINYVAALRDEHARLPLKGLKDKTRFLKHYNNINVCPN